MTTIDIYTTPQCGFCKQLKAILKQEGISYSEHDVTSSEVLLKEMQDITRGALSVPVVVLNKDTDGQKYAIGFEEAKLLLNLEPKEAKGEVKKEDMANLTCPKCGHVQEATIPTTSCVPFYVCDGCKGVVQAEGEDCCVFCSYADRPCPLKSTGKDKECESGCE